MNDGTTRRGRLFIARPAATTGRTEIADIPQDGGSAVHSRLSEERAEERKEPEETLRPRPVVDTVAETLHEVRDWDCAVPQTAEETGAKDADFAPQFNRNAETPYQEPGTFEPEDGPDSVISAPYRRAGDGFDYSHGVKRSLMSRLRSGRCTEWLSSGKAALVGAIAAYILVKYVLLNCIS